MKASDYICEFLVQNECTDIFGYQGGMISHFVDSLSRYKSIRIHTNAHEQAVAFAACGYAQASGKVGVAYCSSGPGATNLITGICHAYYDSVPVVFITGQVNTFESKGKLKVRQKAFQETDIVSMVKTVTKGAYYVDEASKLRYFLEKAFYEAQEGRPGPVLLDIPMNVQRMDVDKDVMSSFEIDNEEEICDFVGIEKLLYEAFDNAKRPCILLGAGIKSKYLHKEYAELIRKWSIPVVTSMIAFDIMSKEDENNYGFIGAYGNRYANFIVSKCDLLITIGTRLDVRQIGAKKENFAPNAKLIRFDIDETELENKVKDDECQVRCSLEDTLKILSKITLCRKRYKEWNQVCYNIKQKLLRYDQELPNEYIRKFSEYVTEDYVITTDVGQNQVWVAQAFQVKKNQIALFSGGHGAMGFSLPAAIGAYWATGKRVICFCGDGGLQMNIQEFQTVISEKIPITIILLNNKSLGMIRHFQEMYFDGNYMQTVSGKGYEAPDFCGIAQAYGMKAKRVTQITELTEELMRDKQQLIEIELDNCTHVFPKLEFGKPNQDQEPLLDRSLYNELMQL